MNLHEYVAKHCPEGARQLRRLIQERTGVQVPYAYVWKWCNPARPCSLSLENATLVHAATDGKCSMEELQTLRKLLGKNGRKRRSKARKRAAKKKPSPRAVANALRKRIRELERRIADIPQSTPA